MDLPSAGALEALAPGTEHLTKFQRGLLVAVMMSEEMLFQICLDKLTQSQGTLDFPTSEGGAPLIFAAAETAFHEFRGTSSSDPDKVVNNPQESGPALRILEKLLVAGASPNVCFTNPANGAVMLPVGLFVEHGIAPVVKLFLKHGYDVMAGVAQHKSRSFLLPLQVAIQSGGGTHEVLPLLVSSPTCDLSVDPRPLWTAAWVGNEDALCMLLAEPKCKAVINAPHPDAAVRQTPLMAAAAQGNVGCARMLIGAGADVQLVLPASVDDSDGCVDLTSGGPPRSCMDWALVGGGQQPMIDLLVKHGAQRPSESVLEAARDGAYAQWMPDYYGFGGSGIESDPHGSGHGGETHPAKASAGSSSSQRCAACSTVAEEGKRLLRCSSCRRVHYCDAACQRSHWPVHKAACSSAAKR